MARQLAAAGRQVNWRGFEAGRTMPRRSPLGKTSSHDTKKVAFWIQNLFIGEEENAMRRSNDCVLPGESNNSL